MSCCWVEEGRRILLQRSFFYLVGFKYHSLGVAFPFPPDLLSLLSRSGGVSPRRFSPGAEIVSVVGFDSSGFADQLRWGANKRTSEEGRGFVLSLGWLLRRRLLVCLPACLPGGGRTLPKPPPPCLRTLAAPLSSLAVLRWWWEIHSTAHIRTTTLHTSSYAYSHSHSFPLQQQLGSIMRTVIFAFKKRNFPYFSSSGTFFVFAARFGNVFVASFPLL